MATKRAGGATRGTKQAVAPAAAPVNIPGPQRTVLDVVDELMPEGSSSLELQETADPRYNRLQRLIVPPQWPADMFAVAATLMELSGCYTEASLVGNHHGMHDAYIDEVLDAAKLWRKTGNCPRVVEEWWSDLIAIHGSLPLSALKHEIPYSRAVATVMRLLAVADEASLGVGWWPREDKKELTKFALRASVSFLDVDADEGAKLRYAPHSLCERVPPWAATVLPKSLTPSVGCTVRAMSHHLALLPPTSVVESEWVVPDNGPTDGTMRLLVIPYPFRVDDESFVPSGPTRDMTSRAKMPPYFTLDPTWLRKPRKVTAKLIRNELIAPMVEQAVAKFGANAIDGVLFPECALTEQLADELLDELAKKPIDGLKFLITGTMAAGEPGDATKDGLPGHNRAKTMVFAPNQKDPKQRVLYGKAHSKHHRWALDREQIKRYGLTGIPSPEPLKVWEHISVGKRQLPFLALRDDLCMTVLICEDLARADPAMPVIRSVGPNLVIALLMDGPQLAVRWPGRYATVLAEDPGSSVLSITSAGMVDRSNLGERNPARAVGLWRHDQGYNTELYLPMGHHGLVLTVAAKEDEQYSLDHRSDLKTTRRWKLETVTPLAVDADWL
jgi:hypothetical protein